MNLENRKSHEIGPKQRILQGLAIVAFAFITAACGSDAVIRPANEIGSNRTDIRCFYYPPDRSDKLGMGKIVKMHRDGEMPSYTNPDYNGIIPSLAARSIYSNPNFVLHPVLQGNPISAPDIYMNVVKFDTEKGCLVADK